MINVVSDIIKINKLFSKIKKQLPFALSRSINGTSFRLRDNIRDKALPRNFILRNKYTQRSIRVKLSSKRDLKSEIFSDAYYLEGQTAGKVRTPIGESFAVPISKQWQNKRKRIPKRIRPNQLFASGKAFIGKTKDGGPAIVLRGKKKGKRPTLITMYSLHTKVKISKTLDINAITKRIVPRVYPGIFQKEIINALRTAK